MPYEIEMADGRVLTGIPDKLDPEKVIAQYESDKKANDPAAGDRGFMKGNFMAGVGSGVVDIGRKATNLLLPDFLTPDFASDEAIAGQKKTDEALLNTGAGLAGNIVGATAATLPVAGAVGMAGRAATGAGRLSKAVQAATRTAPRSAATEGAAMGLVSSNPGERLSGTAGGAILGGTMGAGGQALKRTFASGLVKRTPAAEELGRRGLEVPLGTGAQSKGLSGAVKNIYNDIMPNVPFAGGRVVRQSDHAMENFRNMALRQAIPEGAPVKIDPGDVQGTMRRLTEYWDDEAYKAVKEIPYQVSRDWFPDTALARLRSLPGNVKKEFLRGLKESTDQEGLMDGKALLALKKRMTDAGRSNAGTPTSGQAYHRASKIVDDLMEDQLSPTMWREYQALSRPYAAFRDLRRAAAKASKKEGKFTPAELVGASASRSGERAAAGGEGALQEFGNMGIEALGEGIQDPTFWRRIALAGLTLGSGITNPAVGLPLYGAALAASTRGGQQALQGLRPGQKVLKQALKQYEEPVKQIGRLGRATALQSATRNE